MIGLCGWNGSQAAYFQEFSTIEIQSTFYQPPAARVAARWRSIAPPSFQFCIKAWQLITHRASSPTLRRLSKPLPDADRPHVGAFQPTTIVWDAWQRTLEIAHAVDATVILFQCPNSFLPTSENLANFMSFFQRVTRGQFQLAWEPRGEAWTEDVVRELCQDFDLIHCVDPLTATSCYGTSLYWRLHGLGSYSYQYNDSDLKRLRRVFLQSAKPGFIMFNNFSSKKDAFRFRHMLDAA